MIGKQVSTNLVLLAVLLLTMAVVTAPPARAQFFDETLEQDELFLEDEDQFFEPRGDDLGRPVQEQDFTEGDKFVDDSLTPADQRGLTRGDRRFQLLLEEDRNDLPLNIAWGAGTGLMIGGWYALIAEGDNRQTQRAIGIGIVSGIILGTLIGTRSVFNPEASRPVSQAEPVDKDGNRFTPLVSLNPKEPRVGFQMSF